MRNASRPVWQVARHDELTIALGLERHRSLTRPEVLEQSAGLTEAKPETTRNKARAETKIRYNNLSECAFTKSSLNRPESPLWRKEGYFFFASR